VSKSPLRVSRRRLGERCHWAIAPAKFGSRARRGADPAINVVSGTAQPASVIEANAVAWERDLHVWLTTEDSRGRSAD
jgi:hypothetical protein